jgi:ArsR family transcriptional regulator, arsenate/arsenite/antimonite-responsive transcriptional repressor / arsenate reductase (thioredoxin)
VVLVAQTLEAPQFLRVIGDRHRWTILSLLARSDRRVGELTELVGERQNLVSYHLAGLRDAGLVSSRRSSFDARDTYYRLNVDRCSELFRESAEALHPTLTFVPNAITPPRPGSRMPRVLFLCTGNSARSQMAEALLKHRSEHAVQARSAGSHPKVLHPDAVRVMAERGIDISRNRTKHLRRYTRNHFDFVVTLCDKVREVCPDFPGDPATSHWSMPDPAAEGSDGEDTYPAFERAADELEVRVRQLIAQLFASQGGNAHAR